jgi:hypothetical protein
MFSCRSVSISRDAWVGVVECAAMIGRMPRAVVATFVIVWTDGWLDPAVHRQ